MTQSVDIKELNERIQKESAFVEMVTIEMKKVILKAFKNKRNHSVCLLTKNF